MINKAISFLQSNRRLKSQILSEIFEYKNELQKIKILDLGSSSESHIQKISNKLKELILMDINFLNLNKKKGITYIEGDVRNIENLFKENSIDIIIAIDLVEHLSKSDSILFIKKIKKICKRKVIIYTPNGFLPQPPDPNNPFQEHKCGYTNSELKKLGFKTSGMIGLKNLRGSYHALKKPVLINFILSKVTSIFTRHLFKNLDSAIFAVYKK